MWQLGSSPSTGKSSWSSHYQEKVRSSLPCWASGWGSSGCPPCPESQTVWGRLSPKKKTFWSSLQVITVGNIVWTERWWKIKIMKIPLLSEDLPADYFKTDGCHRCWRWTRCVFLTHIKNWRGLYTFIPCCLSALPSPSLQRLCQNKFNPIRGQKNFKATLKVIKLENNPWLINEWMKGWHKKWGRQRKCGFLTQLTGILILG